MPTPKLLSKPLAKALPKSRRSTFVMAALRAIPFTAVRFNDDFWAPKQRINRTQAIPANEAQCRKTGRIDAFRLAWKKGEPNEPHIFWDSDVAKWIEAAAYSLSTHPDTALDARLDAVIALIASAQQADGYLNTHFSVVRPDERWKHFNDHELYCIGHLLEAGVAHHAATNKRTLLDVCIRLADCVDRVFGPRPGQRRGYCGHEEIELALVKLADATGEKRYRDVARFMVDARGTQPHYFDQLKADAGDDWIYKSDFASNTYRYFQADKPVREQTEVVGHAVRATYLYCAMADLAASDGDTSLAAAGVTLWQHATRNLMYVTGGIGSSHANEGFTFDRDLPNESAYCETCASVGMILWAQRLFLQEQSSEYIDVLERVLYNAAIAGMSLDGKNFFYVNPLASLGNHHRQEWFGCSCCPPNISRLLASLSGYVYVTGDDRLHVNLYAGSQAMVSVGGVEVAINQKTEYPWNGRIEITLTPVTATAFQLRLRRPGWCRSATMRVNGKAVRARDERGYLVLERTWQPGDRVVLNLAMAVEQVHADSRIRQDAGRVALQRGPVIYCLEGCDNGADLDALVIPESARAACRHESKLLGGVTRLKLSGWREQPFADVPYAAARPKRRKIALSAIPYYAWDNRIPGAMAVWIRNN